MQFRTAVWAAAALFSSSALLVTAGAQTEAQQTRHVRYRVIDIGNLGGSFTQPGGISERGDVEGFAQLSGDTQTLAFYLRNGREIVIPGLGGPNSIAGWTPSETGQVAGGAETLSLDPLAENFCGFNTNLICLPFVWKNGKMQALPLPAGNNAAANGFNNRDEVVGKVEKASADPNCAPPHVLQTQGIIWKHRKIERLLPNFPGDLQGAGHQINDLGQVVGWSGSCFEFVTHALIWEHGKPIDLGTISGANNIAYDINNRSQAVGFSGMPDVSFLHGFLWQHGHMQDLGTLPGDAFSLAVGINEPGQIVGGSIDADGNERAVLWQNSVIKDLNSLIPADSPLFLIEAEDLNSSGRIIGVALHTTSGEIHAFLAIPKDDFGARSMSADLNMPGETKHVMLPENVRKQIAERLTRRRRGGR